MSIHLAVPSEEIKSVLVGPYIFTAKCFFHEKLSKIEILFVAPKSEDRELSMTVLELL